MTVIFVVSALKASAIVAKVSLARIALYEVVLPIATIMVNVSISLANVTTAGLVLTAR